MDLSPNAISAMEIAVEKELGRILDLGIEISILLEMKIVDGSGGHDQLARWHLGQSALIRIKSSWKPGKAQLKSWELD